jgi:signal transduction histidine kinase
MLSILVGNAVKFTPAGGVDIEGRVVEEVSQGALVEFSVRDTGIGIAPDKIPHLFKPFTQLDTEANRHYGGTGLGLALVARLAELMEGQVGVESEPGQGSRFWFRVPMASVLSI